MTDEEKLSVDEVQWKSIRASRDQKIAEVSWRVERYHSEIRIGLEPTDDIRALDVYIQALRDITKQPDPFDIEWPALSSSVGINTN